MTQVPIICEEEDSNYCHHTSKQISCITFTSEDIQLKGKHDRPFTTKGHATFEDPHSLVKYHSDNHLWLQRQWYAPDGENQTKCQIEDLKSEVTCYIIDANTSYNLLLGRPWIHCNDIV